MANRSLAKSAHETTVLVTGGAGFIGSHTVVELLERGYRVVILDDLSNSSPVAVDRIRRIAGLDADDPQLVFVQASILDRDALERVFSEYPIDAIIHFAGFKAVGESVQKPLEYYWNNVAGTLVLLDVARNHGVKNIVFSSSATVYGDPAEVPLTEDAPKLPATNPYGQTKSMLEQVMTDMWVGDSEWNIVLLRYFNPIGAHESGLIGEDPRGIPNNLLPYVAKVAVGKLPEVHVFGDDYPTPDGTGIRDYIHVVDLARGHVAALDWMGGKIGSDVESGCSAQNVSRETKANKFAAESDDDARKNVSRETCSFDTLTSLDHGSHRGTPMSDGTRSGVGIFNLGTGMGSSVFDVIHAFENACGKELPFVVEPRRPGDIAVNYAACDKALRELGWQAEYDLDRMCTDSWRWQSQNPDGYGT